MSKVDPLTESMQDEAIKIASNRLGYTLPKNLIANIRQPKWSYIGLEMIIDTVQSIEITELESYIAKLE